MPTFSERITKRLIAARWWLLALAVVLAGAAYPLARDVRFDRSVENMFADDDPLLPPYRRLKRTFGGNEIVMAVYVDPDLFSPAGIDRLARISAACERVPGVKAVLSLERVMGAEIVDDDDPLAVRMRELFENFTHSPDGRTVAVVCMLEPEPTADSSREDTIAQLRAIIANPAAGLPAGVLAGEPVMVVDGFQSVEQDGRRLGLWSSCLLALTILLCFRSLRWVLIPLAVVQLTLLLTRAVLVLSGIQLSMVSSMLTAIVTVIGIATIVHVIVRFREARAGGLPPAKALRAAGSLLCVPVFWAIITDAVGFASLLKAQVGPVQDFGLMMVIGTLLVIVATALLVPGLVLLGRFDADPRTAWGERQLGVGLDRLIQGVQRHPRWVSGGLLAMAVTALTGIFRLEVETDFTKNFRAGSPIVESYEFVERNLGGAGVMDVTLPAPDTLDWNYLNRAQQLQQRLRTEIRVPGPGGESTAGLTKVLSLSDAVIAASPADLSRLQLDLVRETMVRTALATMQVRLPVFYGSLYGADPEQQAGPTNEAADPIADTAGSANADPPGQHYFRLMLRARERQEAEQKLRLIEEVTRITEEAFPDHPPAAEPQVTGFFVLLTNLIRSMIRDQWITFAIATVGIGLMMGVAFRSPLLAAVAIVPNALPILLVLGLMGWAGLRINMGAAMIAAVSMGLSVDSSIHYVTAFRRARLAGRGVADALAEVQQTVGRAVVFSTLALIVGFSVLCTSDFVPTIYFGVLVSLAMLGGLVGNLVLLPLLLKLVSRETV